MQMNIKTYTKSYGNSYTRVEQYWLKTCPVCGVKWESSKNVHSPIDDLCERHKEIYYKRSQAVRSIPKYMLPMPSSLHAVLFHNDIYWLRKNDGFDVSDIEKREISKLKEAGIIDSQIFWNWENNNT